MANKLVARKKIATHIIRENSLVKKKRSLKRVVILVIIICMLIAATVLLILHFVLNGNSNYPIDIGIYSYEIINKYNHIHDPIIGKQANVDSIIHQRYINNHPFTQGLLYIDGNTLIESSGLYAVSYLRKFKLNTGATERYYNLTNNYFAEGIALVVEPETYRKFIFVLTYKENTTCAGFTIKHINELEYHLQEKTIYANIFMTNLVIEIDISRGSCLKIINLSGLIDQNTNKQKTERNRESFLNGIAINPVNSKEALPNLLVTGKFWPNLFEIKLVKTNGMNPNSVLVEYFKTIRHNNP